MEHLKHNLSESQLKQTHSMEQIKHAVPSSEQSKQHSSSSSSSSTKGTTAVEANKHTISMEHIKYLASEQLKHSNSPSDHKLNSSEQVKHSPSMEQIKHAPSNERLKHLSSSDQAKSSSPSSSPSIDRGKFSPERLRPPNTSPEHSKQQENSLLQKPNDSTKAVSPPSEQKRPHKQPSDTRRKSIHNSTPPTLNTNNNTASQQANSTGNNQINSSLERILSPSNSNSSTGNSNTNSTPNSAPINAKSDPNSLPSPPPPATFAHQNPFPAITHTSSLEHLLQPNKTISDSIKTSSGDLKSLFSKKPMEAKRELPITEIRKKHEEEYKMKQEKKKIEQNAQSRFGYFTIQDSFYWNFAIPTLPLFDDKTFEAIPPPKTD